MKIECIKEKLRVAVSQAERVVGRNLALSILSCVVLEAKDKDLRIKATNLDLGVEIVVPAKIHKEGSIALSGSLLSGYLSALRGGDVVVLDKAGENITISSDKTNTLIKTISVDDFPDIPRVEVEQTLTVPVKQFVDGLRNVLYSAAVTDIKPEIASVFVYTANNELVFVATDSFRLSEKRFRTEGVSESKGFLIPHKNAQEVARILEERDGDLEIGYSGNQVAFIMDGLYLTSRLVGGNFPPYEQIIPQAFTTTVVVLKKDILEALKLTNLFTDRFNRISLKVMPKEGLFEIESRDSDTGENTVRIDATLEGSDIALDFNARLIMDCFQSVSDEAVSFNFSGEGKPLVIKPISDATFRYLVMPMLG
ncbi:MAG: DNA polymerase III subunit beta [bacterium]|nr:DNA polymerase III subunit beta [bacterium]